MLVASCEYSAYRSFVKTIVFYVYIYISCLGRAGRTGVSLSLVTRSDWGSAKELIAILEEADQVTLVSSNNVNSFRTGRPDRDDSAACD